MYDITRLEPDSASPLRSDSDGPLPTDLEVEDAFRAIIRWIGEDPDRDGLHETPKRLVKAFREYFCGYDEVIPNACSRRTFGGGRRL